MTFLLIVGVALVVAFALLGWWTVRAAPTAAEARKTRTFYFVVSGLMIGFVGVCLALYIAFALAAPS